MARSAPAVVCCALMSVPWSACGPAAHHPHRAALAALQADAVADVEAIVEDQTGSGVGAAVGYISDGHLTSWVYGLRDDVHPVTTATSFRLSSMTKAFTAMGILILRERGSLRDRAGLDRGLDLTLDQLFDGGSPLFQKLTLRQLLTHSSGLPVYSCPAGHDATHPMSDADVLTEMLAATDASFLFPPGSTYGYSNSGYSLLASVIEKVSGDTYASFMAREIFTPLAMQATLVFDPGHPVVIAERAYGHVRSTSGSGFLSDEDDCTLGVLGDGGIYSSLDDLVRWDASLYPGSPTRLVSDATLVEAFTQGSPTNTEPYGLGWFLAPYRSVLDTSHGGSTRGFRTRIARYTGARVTIVVLTNREDDVDVERNALLASFVDPITDRLLFDFERRFAPILAYQRLGAGSGGSSDGGSGNGDATSSAGRALDPDAVGDQLLLGYAVSDATGDHRHSAGRVAFDGGGALSTIEWPIGAPLRGPGDVSDEQRWSLEQAGRVGRGH